MSRYGLFISKSFRGLDGPPDPCSKLAGEITVVSASRNGDIKPVSMVLMVRLGVNMSPPIQVDWVDGEAWYVLWISWI